MSYRDRLPPRDMPYDSRRPPSPPSAYESGRVPPPRDPYRDDRNMMAHAGHPDQRDYRDDRRGSRDAPYDRARADDGYGRRGYDEPPPRRYEEPAYRREDPYYNARGASPPHEMDMHRQPPLAARGGYEQQARPSYGAPAPAPQPGYNETMYQAPPQQAARPGGPAQHQPWQVQQGGNGGGAPRGAPLHKPMSAVSQSVILLGLPQTCDDVMLRAFLEDMGCHVDTIAIIVDKETGQSKRFAFARFASVEHARSFVEPNFPSVVWRDRTGRGLPEDNGMRIKIDYSQTDRQPNQQRGPPRPNAMPAAVKQPEAPKPPPGPPPPVNDGQRDIGPAPGASLLLRGLDPLTRESEIAQALDTQPGLASAVASGEGVRMVMHVKDRATSGSLCFAFVTYRDAKAALNVLTAIWNPDFHPQGFRIRGHTVTATFAHHESFRPAYATSQYSFKTEAGKDMLYWDDKAYVQTWMSPSIARTPGSGGTARSQIHSIDDDDDTDAFLASFGPATTEPSTAVPTPGPNASAARPAVGNGHAHAQGSPPAPSKSLESRLSQEKSLHERLGLVSENAGRPLSDRVAPANGSGSVPARPPPIDTASAQAHSKKRGADLIASKKAAPDIAKWNNVKKDVDAIPPATQNNGQASSTSQRGKAEDGDPIRPDPPAVADDGYPHGDPIRMTCLLCQRQFQSIEQLDKHNLLSDLHKGNLLNSELVRAADEKKALSIGHHAAEANALQYRDRAAERRTALGQPERPQLDDPRGGKRPRYEPGPTTSTAPPAVQQNTTGIAEDNIGHRMLQAAGWNSGQGLGQGGGRVDPVAARMYASGAGLGSNAGIDVNQRSNDAWNSQAHGRDKARERYVQG